jgi:hypothetical protein
VSREIGFSPLCAQLRYFAAKFWPTVEKTVKAGANTLREFRTESFCERLFLASA